MLLSDWKFMPNYPRNPKYSAAAPSNLEQKPIRYAARAVLHFRARYRGALLKLQDKFLQRF
jgi:hypothetical protein